MAARPPIDIHDPALGLMMAVIDASPTPLLLLDGELRVAGASRSFCDAFAVDPATTQGAALFDLGAGEWDVPPLRTLLDAIAGGTQQGAALEMELARPDGDSRCLMINARLLAYQDPGRPRLMVAVADVTEARADARAKNEAVERLEVLLQEVRQRVANSLQIVSSVLLQHARQTSSTEAKDRFSDAHHRVMAVAALERQLSTVGDGDQSVELHAYFTSLCDNIAASLIGDERVAALIVTGEGVVSSRKSVSLGLIVTELVINALKYAFPDGRVGRIEIDYQARGPNWTLSVKDDGVGMPADPRPVRSGLGTSIVRALARQLGATVAMTPAAPGTLVSIDHVSVALVGNDAGRTPAAAIPDGPGTSPTRTSSERSNAHDRAARR